MMVFEAVKIYEGRRVERCLTESVEVAQAKARNWVEINRRGVIETDDE